MKRKGNMGVWALFGLLAIILVVALMGAGIIAKPDLNLASTAPAPSLASCPDDGDSTITLNLFNTLNTTGSEAFDASWRLYDQTGGFVNSGTTSSDDDHTLNCGETVDLYFLGSDSADSARIYDVEGIEGAKVIDGGKGIRFTPSKSTQTLNVYGQEAGVMEFRMYDNVQAAWMYSSADAENTDWDAEGSTWTSTTNNATATAVGAGGEVDVTIQARSTGSDTAFGDFGYYIAIEATTSSWQEPVVRVDGDKLAEMKGSLNTDESRALADYEFIYEVPMESIEDDTVEVDIYIEALAGVNPTTDLEFDFVSISSYKEVAGSGMGFAAYNDAASPTVIHAVQDVKLDVS